MGTPGNEPEEIARDFTKAYYRYYPCGVYWYDVSDELTLETCVKVVSEVGMCVLCVMYMSVYVCVCGMYVSGFLVYLIL